MAYSSACGDPAPSHSVRRGQPMIGLSLAFKKNSFKALEKVQVLEHIKPNTCSTLAFPINTYETEVSAVQFITFATNV